MELEVAMSLKSFLSDEGWLLSQNTYEREHHSFYETIFALSNGYVGVRHTLEFESEYSVPGTFFANVYDNAVAVPTEIINAPNWMPLKLVIDGYPINLDQVTILDFERTLDMRKGVVHVAARIQDHHGRITQLEWITLVHLKDYHLGLIWGNILPENYSETISVCSYLDYRFGNSYLGGYLPQIMTMHCMPVKVERDVQDGLFLEIRTIASNVHVAEATKLLVDGEVDRYVVYERERVGEIARIEANAGHKYNFSKYVTFYTSNESNQLEQDCKSALRSYIQQEHLVLAERHFQAWQAKWDLADILIEGDSKAQESLRFALFHLIQSAHPEKNGTNIPARGLTSEYHSGHFFFNTELFKLNFFIHFDPDMARSLLLFRYNTLEAAKQHAVKEGYKGAKFPEEVDNMGQLVAPWKITDYFTRETFREWSGREVKHLSADVAYGIFRYFEATNDFEFMLDCGLEMLIETARFGVSLLEWDKEKQAFVIRSVMGLDEYHYHVDNHFYTNYMVKWNIAYALEMLDICETRNRERVQEIMKRTGFSSTERKTWEKLLNLIYLTKKANGHLIEQHEGYFDLPDRVIEKFDENKRPVLSDKDAQQASLLQNFETRLVKQADVVMLLSMFRDQFSYDEKKQNFEFYERRTVHESSLSAAPHAIVACDIGKPDKAYTYFLQSARYNLDFIPKTDYRNGIHVASYAGAWQAVIHGFAGVRAMSNDVLHVNSCLPPHWNSVSFRLHWRKSLLSFTVEHESIQVELLKQAGVEQDIRIQVGGKLISLNRDTPHLQVTLESRVG